MKHILQYVLFLVLFTAQSAWAHGAFFGAGIGMDSTSIQYDLKKNNGQLNRFYNTESLRGALGSLYIGYEINISKQLYLATDFHYDFTHSTFDFSNPLKIPSTDYSYKKLATYGINLMPGIHLSQNNSLYVIIGWVQSKFERQAQSESTLSGDFLKYKSGYRLGLGEEVYLFKQLYMRMQYAFSKYAKIYNTDIDTPGNPSDNKAIYQPESNEFTMGISWHIGQKDSQNQLSKTALSIPGAYFTLGVRGISTRLKEYANDPNDQRVWPHGINGLSATMAAGYSWSLNKFYMATEAFYNPGHADFTLEHINGANRNFKLYNNFSYGLSILPGYLLNESNLLYGRIGWVESQFKKTGSVKAVNLVGNNFNQYQSGLELGIGFETSLCSHLSLVGEYDYMNFSDIHDKLADASFTYKPSSQQYLLAIRYRL